jgi:pimeloyl-ACP methyl ester carboxylesterase
MERSRMVMLAVALALVAVLGGVSRAQAHKPPPATCDATDPETCLYVPEQRYTAGVVDGIVLVDQGRYDYEVPLLVRYPIEAVGPRPVVIWHHGGGPSENGRYRSEEWGEKLAQAGYVVIHPSRTLPDDVTPHLRECEHNGFHDPAQCAGWIAQMRYAPQTTRYLIDHLSDLGARRPVLRDRLDPDTIVVAGHSAGTATVLANAGASQQWLEGGPVHNEVDPRPLGFLATAPQGPTYAGFGSGFDEERSFLEIGRPFLFVTGMGDETGEPIPTRLTAWLTAQPHNKVLAWDTEREAVHETMDIHKCDTALREDHCRWIASAGLAYLDSLTAQRPEAIDWLASDALEIATGGAIEILRR